MNISQCVDTLVIDFVFDLIRDYVVNEDSKIRESVFLAFGSILQTIYASSIKNIIEGALPTLLNSLTDKNIDVRSTVAWVLRKITQYHTDCLINLSNNNPELLEQFVQTIVKNLTSNKRVVYQLVDCFNNIMENTRSFFEEAHPNAMLPSCILSKNYSEILNILISIAYKKDSYDKEYNIALASLYAVNNLIDISPLDCIDSINEYFNSIVTALDNTSCNEIFKEEDEKKFYYQENLTAIINSYLVRDRVSLTQDQSLYLYGIVERIFKERNSVYQSGILLCSKVLIYVFNNFKNVFEDLLKNYCNYLYLGINKIEESDICSISLGIITDFIRLFDYHFEDYLKEMFPKIYSIGKVNIYKL